MPLSPRTLRPANNVFTPKSISGLALWLDASSADTLYTTDAGPVTAVSSPTEISGCALWLDGADSSAASMTLNGSLVETWKDKSGNGRDFTATSTARPTLTPSAINSRSAVTFAGSLTTMTGNTAAQDVIRNLAGYTIFTAIRTASVAGGERFAFGVGSTILFRTGQQDSRPFIGGRRLYADTLESVTDGSGTLTTGTAFIQTAVVNHSSQSLTGIRNGAAFATDATYMGAGTVQNNEAATSVGSQGGGTYGFWNGDIAEIVVFNTALSTADRARVEAYLAAKWAISGVHRSASQEIAAVSSPTELAGCAGWWDCSRTDKMFNATTGGSLVADGGAVLRLEDLSGNGKHLVQATSAYAPSRQDGAKNGLPALNFAGTKALAAGAAGDWNFLHNTQGGTVIAVIKPFDTANPNTFAYGVATNVGGASNHIGWSLFFDDRVSYPRNNYVSHSVMAGVSGQTVLIQEQDNGLPSANDFSLLSFTSFAGSSTTAGRGAMYISGVGTGNANSSTLAPSASNSTNPLTVGSPFGANSIAGLAELIVYSTVLSAVDRARVEKYLQQKWATPTVPDPTPPVGYWADKSGNARHATQSLAASRPTVSVPSGGTEMVNGRRALLAFSSNAGGVSLGNIGSAFPNSSGTAFFAYKVNDGGTGIDNSYGIAMSRLNNSSTQSSGSNEGFWRTSRLAGTNPAPLPTSGYGAAIYTINSAASGYTLRYNSAPFYTTATQDWNAGNSYYLWSDPASNMTRLGGWIGEAILYNRSLSASEARRVEQYLSSRWGIAIAPQVSNADAQDWIDRVYTNGGQVSSATAAAVNTLCDSLDAASLRDRFYRLNLFCGSNLNAALVPLYLTPDKTVTNLFQFGADQTNAAWLPGGNGLITRTATTEVGPLGYGYATKLTTPSAPFDIRQMQQQMPLDGRQVTVSAWMKTNSGTRQIQWLAGNVYSDTVTVTTTWQRFTKTFTLPTSTDARTGFSTVSELSDAAGFIYVWGMQCEYGATATSYNQPRYGNTTDTNNAFVGVGTDYADTGASGGLLGNGTTKYLNTGFNVDQLPGAANCHLSSFITGTQDITSVRTLVGTIFNSVTDRYRLFLRIDSSTPPNYTLQVDLGKSEGVLQTNRTNTSGGLLVGSRTSTTNLSLYANGASAGAPNTNPVAETTGASPFFVFARNGPTEYYNGRMAAYSIGAGMTAAQVTAYNTAMQAFQSAMGRT